jgi:ABC-type oligopeptide transport system substrate-binding subunit
LNLGVALLIAGTLFLTPRDSTLAHPTKTELPVLRLDWGAPLQSGGAYFDRVLPSVIVLDFLVNASLVHLLPSGKAAPDLATWKVSTNRLVYTFTIRPTARFSNGHPVTAQDAAFSLQRTLSPSINPGAGDMLTYLGLIRGAAAYAHGSAKTLTGVKMPSARTLQISLTKPAAYFLGALAFSSAVFDRTVVRGKPVGNPKDNYQTNYLTNTCTGNQGAGPFRFVCHDGSSTLHSFYSGHTPKYTLVPNPSYYGRKPHIRLELRGYDKDLDNYKAYLAGTIDTGVVPLPYLSRWKGKSNEYHEFPTSAVTYLIPNVHLAPFDNVHCRLAVAYALDRDTLANSISGGVRRPTYAIVPKGMLGYYDGKDNPHYNPSRARTELAQCPSRTAPSELVYATGGSNDNFFAAIGNMLAAVGMNAKLKPVSVDQWNTIVSHPLDQSKTELAYVGWAQDYPDPQDYCSLMLRSGSLFNVGGWHNTAYDRLVDRADVLLDPKKRAALYIQAQHLALSQGAFISLTNNLGRVLIKPYVHGLVGSEALGGMVPKDWNWSNVSVSKH